MSSADEIISQLQEMKKTLGPHIGQLQVLDEDAENTLWRFELTSYTTGTGREVDYISFETDEYIDDEEEEEEEDE